MSMLDDQQKIIELCQHDGSVNTSEIQVNMEALKRLMDSGLIYPVVVMLSKEGEKLYPPRKTHYPPPTPPPATERD